MDPNDDIVVLEDEDVDDNEDDAGDVVTEEDDPIPSKLPPAPVNGLYGEDVAQ